MFVAGICVALGLLGSCIHVFEGGGDFCDLPCSTPFVGCELGLGWVSMDRFR